MPRSRYVTVQVEEIVKETDAAFLCRLENDQEEWLPKSQLEDPEEFHEGDEDIEMSVTRWIAEQKGLEYDD